MAEVSNESWAKTFTVDNVQALAATVNDSGADIPASYIRPERDSEIIDEANEKVPIIDLSRLLDPEFTADERNKLDAACRDWGFFQLVNHGIPERVIENMKVDLQEFFRLPVHEKQTVAPSPGGLQGYGHNFLDSDSKKLDWNDFLFLMTRPVETRNMTFWPINPSTFRTSMNEYSLELKKVANSLFEITAKNLGVDPVEFLRIFRDIPQSMKMNYYPPCVEANKVIGLSPHSDVSGLSLVLQIGDVQGLQISRNGKWFPVEAFEHALLVNVGDVLEVLSNGNYKSIEHRVVVDNNKERLSIVAFHSPNMDSEIGPLPELVEEEEARFKTMSFAYIKKHHFQAQLEGKIHMENYRLRK